MMLAEKDSAGCKGFTLIELLIALAIISVLAVILFPNVSDYLSKGRRPDGKVLLLEIANAQQNFYSDPPNSYANTLAALGYTSPQPSENGYYSVTLGVTPGGCTPAGTVCTGYTLTAAPQGPQAGDDCGSLTLNNFGVPGVTGGTLTAAECW